MTLFASTARRRGGGFWTDEDPPGAVPYAMPTSAPWHVPTYTITPTSDGTGSGTHPSVIDFAQILPEKQWRGWRYWMVFTEYYASNIAKENPSILVSQDGFTWEVPAGVTNPIYPYPGDGVGYNSDTDLEYDVENDQLVMAYRGPDYATYIAQSDDGVTWPATATRHAVTSSVCPILARRGPGDWWLFVIDTFAPKRLVYSQASGPQGPWTTWTTQLPAPDFWGPYIWHGDIIWHQGAFRCVMDLRHGNPGPDGIADGMVVGSWSGEPGTVFNWSPIIMYRPVGSSWGDADLYRPTLQPMGDGTRYRIWYSADSTNVATSWRIGYVQLPARLWPAP